jgi:hypothetical protein
LLGCTAVVLVLVLREPAFEEVEEYYPAASVELIEGWEADLQRRAGRWLNQVPDPPGEGPVVTARYWLSRYSYDMEVRRRGKHFVVVVAGVAPHIVGGPWASYGEGRIEAPGKGFVGATATFSWSCLGVRYRHASDGVGRLLFDADGVGVAAYYMAYEAPALWAKAYGRLATPGEEAPPYTTLRGQIPITPVLERLPADAAYRVRVRVTDSEGNAIPGALVQLKGHSDTLLNTDTEGRGVVAFRGGDMPWSPVISAGGDGFLNGEVVLFAGDSWPGLTAGGESRDEVVVALARLDTQDHPAYRWVRASGADDPDDLMACGTCHPWHYDQWFESRHARMADNGFVTWERARMRAEDAAAPDDCHGCHQPAHAVEAPDATWKPRGPMAGNHCDFCHKIARVKDVEASGVLGGYDVLRPDPDSRQRPGGIHHVFGTAPDVTFAYMGAAYSSLFAGSHLCAGCHQGGGRAASGSPPKIDTYNEWSDWAARQAPEDVQTCQDCHMASGGMVSREGEHLDQMAWDGMHRTPEHSHSHRFLGVDAPFAAKALSVKVDKRRDMDTGEWTVRVEVTNSGAGHKVPTGTWSKRVIVGVWASLQGKPLRQVGGDRSRLDPGASSEIAYAAGDWRNPGGFVLGVRARSDAEGLQTAPSFWAPWRAEDIVDERLGAGETRVATCRFEGPVGEAVPEVEVRVLYRRARLAGGAASVPWTVGPHDPAPEVLWLRLQR